MSKASTVKGIMKTFWSMAIDDWKEMDHKLVRVAFGTVSFVAATLFWFYFLRHILPF